MSTHELSELAERLAKRSDEIGRGAHMSWMDGCDSSLDDAVSRALAEVADAIKSIAGSPEEAGA